MGEPPRVGCVSRTFPTVACTFQGQPVDSCHHDNGLHIVATQITENSQLQVPSSRQQPTTQARAQLVGTSGCEGGSNNDHPISSDASPSVPAADVRHKCDPAPAAESAAMRSQVHCGAQIQGHEHSHSMVQKSEDNSGHERQATYVFNHANGPPDPNISPLPQQQQNDQSCRRSRNRCKSNSNNSISSMSISSSMSSRH